MSQKVPGNARAGHSRRVARSWPRSGSATGLELRPGLSPERLGARGNLVERESVREVAGDHHGVHQVVGDVALVDQVASRELRQRRLVAVPPEVAEADLVVEQVV